MCLTRLIRLPTLSLDSAVRTMYDLQKYLKVLSRPGHWHLSVATSAIRSDSLLMEGDDGSICSQ
jgi:hypothetical protein